MRTLLLTMELVLGTSAVPNFAAGTLAYAQGTAARRGYGLPSYRYPSLDPVTRTYWRSEGCGFFLSISLFAHLPHNAAIELLSRLFGPMSGAYKGPYPTRIQAERALAQSGLVVTVREVLHSEARLPGCWGPARLSRLLDELTVVCWDCETELRLAVVDGTCLVVGVDSPGRCERLVLYDAVSFRPFTVY